MLRMKEEDFKKLLLIATTIENLQNLGFHPRKCPEVLENLYGEYGAYVKHMSPADLLAFAQFMKGEGNV